MYIIYICIRRWSSHTKLISSSNVQHSVVIISRNTLERYEERASRVFFLYMYYIIHNCNYVSSARACIFFLLVYRYFCVCKYVCYLKCYLVFNVITLFYYQGALAMSAKLRNVNRKIVHSAIERKGIRFRQSVNTHGCVGLCMSVYVCVCVSAIFYISSQHTAIPFPYHLSISEKWLVWLISLTFKRTDLLGCLLGTIIRQRRSPESYKCILLSPFSRLFTVFFKA